MERRQCIGESLKNRVIDAERHGQRRRRHWFRWKRERFIAPMIFIIIENDVTIRCLFVEKSFMTLGRTCRKWNCRFDRNRKPWRLAVIDSEWGRIDDGRRRAWLSASPLDTSSQKHSMHWEECEEKEKLLHDDRRQSMNNVERGSYCSTVHCEVSAWKKSRLQREEDEEKLYCTVTVSKNERIRERTASA